MEEVNHCPVCSGTVFATVATPQRLEEERQIREKFVAQRLIRSAHPNELKDPTDFIHAEKAHLTECASCTLLVRKEHAPPPAQNYSKDDYDPTVMENLFPRYVDAFRKKEKPYRTLLPERARVVEVGRPPTVLRLQRRPPLHLLASHIALRELRVTAGSRRILGKAIGRRRKTKMRLAQRQIRLVLANHSHLAKRAIARQKRREVRPSPQSDAPND